MTEIAAIGVVSPAVFPDRAEAAQAAGGLAPVGFEALLTNGLQAADAKIAHSDALVRQFAIDGSVPLHQVTIALEEARIAVELAMQFRARLVESYRELMNMQL